MTYTITRERETIHFTTPFPLGVHIQSIEHLLALKDNKSNKIGIIKVGV